MYMSEEELQQWMAQRREMGEAVQKLKDQFEESLQAIKQIKSRVIATQDFEYASIIRNIEKMIEESRDLLRSNLG